MSRAEAESRARELGQELFPRSDGVWHGLAGTARLPATWALVALYFVSFGGFLALTAWFPTYWQEEHGTAATTAGALTMLYSVGASLIRVVGGTWSDRFGGGRVAVLSFALTALGASLLALGAGFWISVAGLVGMAAGMGVANAAVFKLVPQLLAGVAGGAGAGWVGGLGAFGGFALPPILGWLVERFGPQQGYPLGFVVFIGLGIGAAALALVLHRRTRDRLIAAATGTRDRAAA